MTALEGAPDWRTEAETNAAPGEAPTVTPQTAAPRAGAQILPVALIEPNPNQPRRRFDPDELHALAASIREHGVLQPLLVRPSPHRPMRFEIIAGERRWRAAQLAEQLVVPVFVREADDRQLLQISIIENVQRADLNPIEEALGYQTLIAEFAMTQQEVADQIGRSRSHVANLLRLLQLPDEIQDMVREGRLTAGHARALLGAPDMMALARLAAEGQRSVRDLERIAQQARDPAPTAPAAARAVLSDNLIEMQAAIAEALALAVRIKPEGAEGGEVRIRYTTAGDLAALFERLTGAAAANR